MKPIEKEQFFVKSFLIISLFGITLTAATIADIIAIYGDIPHKKFQMIVFQLGFLFCVIAIFLALYMTVKKKILYSRAAEESKKRGKDKEIEYLQSQCEKVYQYAEANDDCRQHIERATSPLLQENERLKERLAALENSSEARPTNWEITLTPLCMFYRRVLESLLEHILDRQQLNSFKATKEDFADVVKTRFNPGEEPLGKAIDLAWKQWPESLKYDRGKNPSKEEKEAFRAKFGHNHSQLN